MSAPGADFAVVQFERLIIESKRQTFTLDLDPRLTVIAGAGPLEREGLITELVDSLSAGREGVHIELKSDAGDSFVIARPIGCPPRIVGSDERDVTTSFTDTTGRVNFIERAGLSPDRARRLMRFSDEDLTTRSEEDARLMRLARVDQGRLWELARKIADRHADLERIADTIGGEAIDADLLAEIEARHAAFERAEAGHERARSFTMLAAITATMLIVPLAAAFGLATAGVATIAAICAGSYSLLYWWRMEKARRHEQDALESTGSRSYLAFQLTTANGLLSNDRERAEMMRSAEYHRSAIAEWQLLADGVDYDWAVAHRSEIRDAASRLRETVEMRNPMATTMSSDEEHSADLTTALLRRATELRDAGPGGESLPMFVDVAFSRVTRSKTRADLLRSIQQVARHQQVIVLTDGDDLIDWAREQAASGSLVLIEPATAAETHAKRNHTAA